MRIDKNIEDWYKNELENYTPNPDDKVWNKLSDSLDNALNGEITEENIENWYKKEAENYLIEPNKEVWNRLSTKLDLVNVWDKLLISLNKYEQLIWWRNTLLKGLAISVFLIGIYLSVNNDKQPTYQMRSYQPYYTEVNSKTNDNELFVYKEKTHVINGIKHNIKVIQADNKVKSNKRKYKSKPKYNTNNIGVKTIKDYLNELSFISAKEYYYEPENILDNNQEALLLASLDEADNLTSQYFSEEKYIALKRKEYEEFIKRYNYLKGDFLVKKKNDKIIFNNKRFSSYFAFGMYAKRFYGGLNFGIKNNYFLNDHLDKSLAVKNFTTGISLGSNIGYIYSDNLNFETNINFLDYSGQNYHFKSLSNTVDVSLSYLSISVLAKKMNNKRSFNNRKFSNNLIGGFYAGYLTKQTIDGNLNAQIPKHKKLDFGIVLGMERDIYLSKELAITPGVRTKYGLVNLTENNVENEVIIDNYNNFSVELNVGIKYIFLKKEAKSNHSSY